MTLLAMKKSIAHMDLDCFFVSVERLRDPSLNGKPVIVGGSATGRGVVASASYEARTYGVRSAMPTARALRLCPHLVVIPGHHEEYSRYSDLIYNRMRDVAPAVERASIDEMYLDFTGCEALYDHDLPGYMHKLQDMIGREFHLPCTIALASNKLAAKIAANTVKPAGVIHVPHGTEKEFLAPLPIAALPGVGRKTEDLLKRKGLIRVGDLQALSLEQVVQVLGAHGEWLLHASHGRGSSTVEEEHVRKSISREETFSRDVTDAHELGKTLFALVENVCSTLRRHSLRARTVTLKLRSHKFETITRQRSMEATKYDPAVFQTANELLHEAHDPGVPVRLLGVGLSHFVAEVEMQQELFAADDKHDTMLRAIDELREKYGRAVIDIGGV